MGRKTSRMITAAALAAAAPAAAVAAPASPAIPVATSYADLLQPIPNAEERLAAADREAAQRPAGLIRAQYAPAYPAYHHHHHHHHHHHSRYWYRSHGYVWGNGGWVLRPVRHHHHHHHHHNSYYEPR